jgi:hypothetical protein
MAEWVLQVGLHPAARTLLAGSTCGGRPRGRRASRAQGTCLPPSPLLPRSLSTQNYDEQYALYDYESLLQDPGVARLAAEHLAAHRAASSSDDEAEPALAAAAAVAPPPAELLSGRSLPPSPRDSPLKTLGQLHAPAGKPTPVEEAPLLAPPPLASVQPPHEQWQAEPQQEQWQAEPQQDQWQLEPQQEQWQAEPQQEQWQPEQQPALPVPSVGGLQLGIPAGEPGALGAGLALAGSADVALGQLVAGVGGAVRGLLPGVPRCDACLAVARRWRVAQSRGSTRRRGGQTCQATQPGDACRRPQAEGWEASHGDALGTGGVVRRGG